MKTHILFITFLLATTLMLRAETARTLTDNKGRKIEATLLDATESHVTFRNKEGKEFTVLQSILSEADREFIAQWQREMKNPPKPAPEPLPVVEVAAAPVSDFVPLVPPHGRKPVLRSFMKTDGTEITAKLLDCDVSSVSLLERGSQKISVPLADFTLPDRVFIRNWRFDTPVAPSLERDFTQGGETFPARVVEATSDTVSLKKSNGEITENIPQSEFTKEDQDFIIAWLESRWINRGWEWTIQPLYDEVRSFDELGVCRVRKAAFWGLLDSTGKELTEMAYDLIGDFLPDGTATMVRNGKHGCIDVTGKIIIEPVWDDIGSHVAGYYSVKRDGQWGYIDESGVLVIPCDWDEVGAFSPDGLAFVKRGGRTGCIDKSGKIILPPEWDSGTRNASGSLVGVRRGETWSGIDSEGNVGGAYIRDDFPSVPAAVKKVAALQSSHERVGNTYQRKFYVWITGDYQSGQDLGRWDEGYESDGFIFLQGKEGPGIVVDNEGSVVYSSERGFRPMRSGTPIGFSEGLAIVVSRRPGDPSRDHYGFIDKKGTLVIPFDTGRPRPFSEGLAEDSKDKKWGFIDPVGKVAIAYKWEDVGPFREGLAGVKRAGKWGFIDRSGTVVIQPEYERVNWFQGGLAAIRKEGKWGYVNAIGEMVIEPMWVSAGSFSQGLAGVTEAGGVWQYIDATGAVAIPTVPGFKFRTGAPPEFQNGWIQGYLVSPGHDGRRGTSAYDSVRINLKGELRRDLTSMGDVTESLSFGDAGMGGYRQSRSRSERFSVLTSEQDLVIPNVGRGFDVNSELNPYREPKKFGILGLDGEIIVPPMWESADVLSPERILFGMGGKFGIADATGAVLREPVWEEAWVSENDQRITIRLGTEHGIVNYDGDAVAGATSGYLKFKGADGASLLPEATPSWTFVDDYGMTKAVLKRPDGNGQTIWAIFDPSTKELQEIPEARRLYWNKSCAEFGVLWALKEGSEDWHLMTSKGVDLGYSQKSKPFRWDFGEGLAVVRKDGKAFFIRNNGEAAFDTTWESARNFSSGLAAVKLGGKWGYIDRTGKLVLEPKWDFALDFIPIPGAAADIVAPAQVMTGKDGRWGFIDRNGDWILEPFLEPGQHESKMIQSLSLYLQKEPINGMTAADMYIMIARSSIWQTVGRDSFWMTVPITIDRVWGTHGLRSDGLRGGYYLLDGAGKKLSDTEWEAPWFGARADSLANGLITARTISQKYGLIDSEGKEVVAPVFDRICWVGPGVAAVWGNENGLIDSSGKWLFRDNGENQISRFDAYRTTPSYCRHGLVVIENIPKWGFARLKR